MFEHLILFASLFTACTFPPTDFVVVNESDYPIEVRYAEKRPASRIALSVTPSKIAASQLSTRGNQQWKILPSDQYQIDQATHTIIVNVMPHEALQVASMFHYIGDEDPSDVENFPIEEITVTGADGRMTFTGQKARKSFSYVSRELYTLTYK